MQFDHVETMLYMALVHEIYAGHFLYDGKAVLVLLILFP